MPRVHGDGAELHVSEVDAIVEKPLKVSIMDGLASTINALGAQPIEA
jgi:hypothetical protein